MKLEFKPYTGEIKLVPGMIIKKEDNLIEIVGHINNKEGYCDCCSYGKIIEYSDTFLDTIHESISICYKNMDSFPLDIAEHFLKIGVPVTHNTFNEHQFLQKIDKFLFINKDVKVTKIDDFKRTFWHKSYETGWKVFKKSTNQGTKESPTAGQSE